MNLGIRRIRTRIARLVAPWPLSPEQCDDVYPRIYFCHVPKCGGRSVGPAIWNGVYPDATVGRFAIDFAIDHYAGKAAGEVFDLPSMRVREIVLAYQLSDPRLFFGSGHCCCSPSLVERYCGQWNFVTVLRNPVDRWISEYVYNTHKTDSWGKNNLPLDEYLDSYGAVHTGRSFLHYFSSFADSGPEAAPRGEHVDEALQTLSRFCVVGTIESMPAWSRKMKAAFGVTVVPGRMNKSPMPEEAALIRSDAGIMRRIEEHCQLDLEVYE